MSTLNVNTIYDSTGGDTAVLNGVLSTPLGTRNKIINGKMEIAQRGTSFPNSNDYTLDRWLAGYVTTAGRFTVSQSTDVPTGGEFGYSLAATVTTADTSVTAGDVAYILQRIEGYNARDLVGRTFTISFWVKSSKTGVHCLCLHNDAFNRTMIKEYTVSAANTWEKQTITITGGLVLGAGTWNFTNGIGLRVNFVLMAGTTYQGTKDTWLTTGMWGTASQVNCLDAINNVFAITGVQLEVGSVATPFEHRPYAMELALCQRYLPSFNAVGSTDDVGWGATTTTSAGIAAYEFLVEPRVPPTGITVSSVSHFTFTTMPAGTTVTALTFSLASRRMARLNVTGTGAPYGAYQPAILLANNGSARLLFTGCEL